jgi:hypothetical protein
MLKGKWGYIDKDKNEVIPCKYDVAKMFSEGFATVTLNDKTGFIDRTGKEIIPLKYNGAGSFSDGHAPVALDGKWSFINTTGKEIIPYIYDGIEDFHRGLAIVRLDDQYGFIDTTGKEIIPCIYDYAGPFSYFDYEDTEPFYNATARVRLNGVEFNISRTNYAEWLDRVYLNNKWGFMNNKGKEIIPCIYDYAEDFDKNLQGLALVKLNNKCHYIDKNGIRWKYEEAYGFDGGLAPVMLNGKWGYIDKDKDEVIPLKYDMANSFNIYLQGLAWVKLNNKGYYIDKNETRWKYEEAYRFHEGLAPVMLNGKWGYIDKNKDEVIPCKYDDAIDFSDGLARVQLNGKWFYIDKTGEYVKE